MTTPSNNHILFVCSNPPVTEFLYELFGSDPELSKRYYIEGSAATRESAIQICREKRPGTVLFFERTAGISSISKTIYNIRMTGARVVYISSQRHIGDPVLEALVSYGVYDLVLEDEISSELIQRYLLNPRDFKDVSVFKREIDIKDEGGGEKGFVVPNLDLARQFSAHLDTDYLIDPLERSAARTAPRINRSSEQVGVSEQLYKEADQAKRVADMEAKRIMEERKRKAAEQVAKERGFSVPVFD